MENKKSNRAVGNEFEQSFCEILAEHGFWCHRLTQDSAGQPADVIAVKDQLAYLIDCKDCEHRGFYLRRIEENQVNAMDLWADCGNKQGWFALRIPSGEIFMFQLVIMMDFRARQAGLSFDEIRKWGIPLSEWVMWK